MALDQRSKKELVEIIHQLQDKLKEMKQIETKVTTEEADLSRKAIGVHKDKNGNYFAVNLVYDIEKNAATIKSIDNLNTKDYAILVYQAKKYLGDVIAQSQTKEKNV